MSRTPARVTQADVARTPPQSVVYFVRIGNFIKIGFTTNLKQRLAAFLTSAPSAELLLSIPGDRSLEQMLQTHLADCRVDRELFRPEYRVIEFIANYKYGGMERGLRFLDATDPTKNDRRREEDRERRVAVARQSKAERNAYFASLVAERKRRLGW
jgi:hypothetical protein